MSATVGQVWEPHEQRRISHKWRSQHLLISSELSNYFNQTEQATSSLSMILVGLAKHFLYNTPPAEIKGRGLFATPVELFGIASELMDRGRTAHLILKKYPIPIKNKIPVVLVSSQAQRGGRYFLSLLLQHIRELYYLIRKWRPPSAG